MADTEKITINMSVVDLGRVDLLVEEGFYSNRSDFIRTAIRNQLAKHATEVAASVTRRSTSLGVIYFSRKDLEKARATGQMIEIRAVGMAVIANDVSPELAKATIASVEVFGTLKASDAVKRALGK